MDNISKVKNKNRIIAVLIVVISSVLFSLSGYCWAQEQISQDNQDHTNGNGNTLFYQANSLYKEAKYKEAISAYEELLDNNIETGAVCYNLGNTYFKAGQRGRAILNYLRAGRLAPRDPDLRENLSYARSLIKGGQTPLKGGWIFKTWDDLCRSITINETACLVSVFYLLGMVMLIICVLNRKIRKTLRYFIIVSGCVFILFALALITQINWFEYQTRAVVINDQVRIVFEPSEDAMDTELLLYEGHTVRIIGTDGRFYKIKRPDGQSGWVRSEDLELL